MANVQVTTRDTQLEKQRVKKLQISLTNFANTSAPQIAAGSVIEVGGSLYVFSSNETISGWTSIGNNTDCYVKLTPGASSVTASYTTSAPTWSDAKQGWYDGNDRYIAGLHRGASSAVYADKWIYQHSQDNNANHRFLGDGSVEFDSGIVADVTGDLTGDVTGNLDGGVEDQNGAVVLKMGMVEIGTWNMDSTQVIQISAASLGLSNVSQIRAIRGIVRRDDDGFRYPDNYNGGWAVLINMSNNSVDPNRASGGTFDSTNFDTMGDDGNRGWLFFWYV